MLRSRLFSRSLRLATTPNATLRVSGACASLVVRTNSETYAADLEATTEDGAAHADADLESWATADANGDLTVVVAAGRGATTVSVPAAFNVSVDMTGTCDVDLQGWMEGTVSLATGDGSVGVGTVRGLLTSVRTGGGDVRVDHVEGNLDVDTGGSVVLGKILGEDVRCRAGGRVKSKALYTKALELEAAGGVEAAVLSVENNGRLGVGAATTLDSVEGTLRVDVAGKGDFEVQASESLQKLHVVRSAPSQGRVVVYLSEGMGARAEVLAAECSVDERLNAEAAADGGAAAVYVVDGSGGASGDACELKVEAAECHVTLGQQSWLEQRMKRSAPRDSGMRGYR